MSIISKAGVISVDYNWISQQEVPPILQSSVDGGELLVVDIIVSFCIRKRLGVITDWSDLIAFISLEKDGARGVVRCINF